MGPISPSHPAWAIALFFGDQRAKARLIGLPNEPLVTSPERIDGRLHLGGYFFRLA